MFKAQDPKHGVKFIKQLELKIPLFISITIGQKLHVLKTVGNILATFCTFIINALDMNMFK